jgi:hypothetical protein
MTISVQQAQQLELARSLVGKRVQWAYVKDDGRDLFGQAAPPMAVECSTPGGMVCVSGFVGEFSPHLFRVVG